MLTETMPVRKAKTTAMISQASTEFVNKTEENKVTMVEVGTEVGVKQVETGKKLVITKELLLSNFLMFCVVVLGMMVMPFHVLWARFQESRKRSLILAPRDHGKSMLLTIAFCVWHILKNPNIRILIISNSAGMAQNFLAAIKSHFERNTILRALFGNLVGDVWNVENIIVRTRTAVGLKEPTVSTCGVFGSLISGHFDIIIADDIVDFENSRTKSMRDKVWDWFWMVLYPTLETSEIDPSKDGHMHLNGTRYHHDDLYGRLIGDVDRYRPAAYEGNWIRDQAIKEDTALWPERKSLVTLTKIKQDVGSIIFALQYQNDASLTIGRIFQLEYFANTYASLPDEHLLVAGYDLAVKEKEQHDYFAEVIIATDKKKNVYLVNAAHMRMSAPKQYDRIKSSHETWKYTRCGVESVAYQEALPQWLRENTDVPVKSINRTKDKVTRAYKIQPLFENGKFFMPAGKKFHDLTEEMTMFPDADHDDLFDALETAITTAQGGQFDFFFLD